MEKMQNPVAATKEELGLLDVLVILAENVKLLVTGSLLVGLCALGLSFLLPPTYQSVAVLQAEQATASLMTTAAVLDPVIASLGLAKGNAFDEARIELRKQIKTAVGRNDKLLTLTVSDRMAQQAQAIANAVLKQTYQESRPKGSARKRLEVQLAEAQARLNNAQDASVGVLKRLESSGSGVGGGAELARGYAELLTATGAAQGQISALETQLEGLSEAMLIQSPTLPRKASQPKKGLIAIGATLATGLALLLFVFMRQALLGNVENVSVAGKWARIRQSLGLK
jgi:uncharacterized protein involved in exopolysaccharide biosynthesis